LLDRARVPYRGGEERHSVDELAEDLGHPDDVRLKPKDWATLYTTESRPFPAPETGKIAVKVNDYGDEVMKVFSA
jgi:hypothetical protein